MRCLKSARGRRAAAYGAPLLALFLVSAVPTAQDWRTTALASFDEAWTTINDTFYDPAFGGLDWAAVRKELRPRVESAATPAAARAVIVDMLARLKRSHFGLLSSSSADALPGPASVPIDVRVAREGVVITRVTERSASAAGLAPGQVLVSLDGRAVADLKRGTEQLDPRASTLEIWRRVNRALHGWDGSSLALTVREVSGTERTITAKRTMSVGESVTYGNLPPLVVRFDTRELTAGSRRIGLIGFNFWMIPVVRQLDAAVDRFRAHDGVVLDLRGNPGGLAAMIGGVAGHFVGEPLLLGTMRTRQTTLKFEVNPRLVSSDGRKVDVFRGPLAILVDELTGSTSETFVGALQGLGRARVFGRQTMGQALPALTRQLPAGDVMMYAIGDFTTSSGKSLEGAGVVPDLSVLLSVKALAAGRDEVLDAALQWLSTAKAP